MTDNFLLLTGLSLAICCISMFILWLFAKKIDNYSIVDAAWSYAFFVVCGLYACLANGSLPRRILITAVVGIWSLRLGTFLFKRIKRHHPHEDRRYLKLRKEYGKNLKLRFLIFFQLQAISIPLLCLPFLQICLSKNPEFNPVEIIGALVALGSILGEAVADKQQKEFRDDPANKNRVCDVGLWKYSRHPNYFFESCIWWGYFLFAFAASGNIYSLYCPIIILLLLLKVTGVPMSEELSLESKGDLYRQYQARTSVFVPWKPKYK